MADTVSLYNAGLTDGELKSLLSDIRSSSYIDEIESGEVAREQSSLWDLLSVVQSSDTSTESIVKQHVTASSKAADSRVLVIANEKSGKFLLVVSLKDKAKSDEMKTAPKDVLEVCSTLMNGKMELKDYKSMAGNADVFDSGREKVIGALPHVTPILDARDHKAKDAPLPGDLQEANLMRGLAPVTVLHGKFTLTSNLARKTLQ